MPTRPASQSSLRVFASIVAETMENVANSGTILRIGSLECPLTAYVHAKERDLTDAVGVRLSARLVYKSNKRRKCPEEVIWIVSRSLSGTS
jgi:hypothetical protein